LVNNRLAHSTSPNSLFSGNMYIYCMKQALTKAAFLLSLMCMVSCSNKAQTTDDLSKIKLPPGFHISYFAKNITGARSLAIGAKGTVFVSTKDFDKVYALVDANNDGVADKKYIVAKNMSTPNGVAFHNGSLYIAEVSKIWRIDNIEQNLANPPKPVLVYDKFPTDAHHGWKYIAFGPDGKLYVPVGAPCNICDKSDKDPRYAGITRMNPDGTGQEVYAKGIRNTVGFDWHPVTKELWFTDNGRDLMGDNFPPDELNCAPAKGMHFGYPYRHGDNIPDPEYGRKYACTECVPPVAKLQAHVAALGMKFYTGNMFPPEYKNQVFIAEHGSWNRTDPDGYRITLVRLKGNKEKTYEIFADGWLQGRTPWGRPVDLLVLKDGSMLVSDDMNHAVYRITYSKK